MHKGSVLNLFKGCNSRHCAAVIAVNRYDVDILLWPFRNISRKLMSEVLKEGRSCCVYINSHEQTQ